MSEMSESTPDYLTRHGPPHRAIERRRIPTGRPGLRVRCYPGVPDDVRDALRAFARWLRAEIDFRDPVRVTVATQTTVAGHEGAPGWAVFLVPPPDHAPGDVVRIVLAAGRVTMLEREYRLSREEALARLLHDLAHEIVHYEQWRDGRSIDERGVNRRAAALVRRFRERAPRPRPRRRGAPRSGSRARRS